jgi:hypothetical protein
MKKELKLNITSLKLFVPTRKVDELAEKHHVDTNIVLHVLQAVVEQIKAPKKGWIRYGKPSEKAPPKSKTSYSYIGAHYEEPLLFPKTKRMYEQSYEAQVCAKHTEK